MVAVPQLQEEDMTGAWYLDRYDVAVIGCGLAGASLAFYLRDSGLRVLVLERKGRPGFPVRCGCGFSEACFSLGYPLRKEWIVEELRGIEMITPTLHRYYSEETAGYVLKKDSLIYHLAGEARKGGVELAAGTRVLGMEHGSPEGYRIRADRRDATAEIVADCGGHNSSVRSFLGLPRQETRGAVRYSFAPDQFDPSVLGSGSGPGRRYATFLFDAGLFRGGYAWSFPMGDSVQLGAVSSENPADGLVRLSESLGIVLPEPRETVGGRIPCGGLEKKLTYGNILLVGDAAGAVNPMNFAGNLGAMLSGALAGKAVIEYFKKRKKNEDDCTNALADYERSMKAHPSQSSELARGARALYSLSNEALDLLGGKTK